MAPRSLRQRAWTKRSAQSATKPETSASGIAVISVPAKTRRRSADRALGMSQPVRRRRGRCRPNARTEDAASWSGACVMASFGGCSDEVCCGASSERVTGSIGAGVDARARCALWHRSRRVSARASLSPRAIAISRTSAASVRARPSRNAWYTVDRGGVAAASETPTALRSTLMRREISAKLVSPRCALRARSSATISSKVTAAFRSSSTSGLQSSGVRFILFGQSVTASSPEYLFENCARTAEIS